MSESESLEGRVLQSSTGLTSADDLVQRLESRTVSEREGLPRNYRMRADAHHSEQLGAPAQPVIRMLATAHIECRDLPTPERVEPLTKSIATYGVLQPLIVRRHAARYSLIAGRKRLAAAMAANIGAVPCLLHDVDGAAAAAIAEADNLRIHDPRDKESEAVRAELQVVDADLSTIRASLSLLGAPCHGGLPHQVGVDLIAAQASRAAWIVRSMLADFGEDRQVPLAAIVQRVEDEFKAHGALMGLRLDCALSPSAAVRELPEEATTRAITGGIFGMLACLDVAVKPCIELHAETSQARMVKIEIIQRAVRVPSTFGQSTEPHFNGRPEALLPALALRVANTVAKARGGSAELSALPGIGSVLRMTFGNSE